MHLFAQKNWPRVPHCITRSNVPANCFKFLALNMDLSAYLSIYTSVFQANMSLLQTLYMHLWINASNILGISHFLILFPCSLFHLSWAILIAFNYVSSSTYNDSFSNRLVMPIIFCSVMSLSHTSSHVTWKDDFSQT